MAGLRLFLLQSAQLLLPSSLSRVLMVCWFCAARSAAALGGALLDIAPVVRSKEFNGRCEPAVGRALFSIHINRDVGGCLG